MRIPSLNNTPLFGARHQDPSTNPKGLGIRGSVALATAAGLAGALGAGAVGPAMATPDADAYTPTTASVTGPEAGIEQTDAGKSAFSTPTTPVGMGLKASVTTTATSADTQAPDTEAPAVEEATTEEAATSIGGGATSEEVPQRYEDMTPEQQAAYDAEEEAAMADFDDLAALEADVAADEARDAALDAHTLDSGEAEAAGHAPSAEEQSAAESAVQDAAKALADAKAATTPEGQQAIYDAAFAQALEESSANPDGSPTDTTGMTDAEIAEDTQFNLEMAKIAAESAVSDAESDVTTSGVGDEFEVERGASAGNTYRNHIIQGPDGMPIENPDGSLVTAPVRTGYSIDAATGATANGTRNDQGGVTIDAANVQYPDLMSYAPGGSNAPPATPPAPPPQ